MYFVGLLLLLLLVPVHVRADLSLLPLSRDTSCHREHHDPGGLAINYENRVNAASPANASTLTLSFTKYDALWNVSDLEPRTRALKADHGLYWCNNMCPGEDDKTTHDCEHLTGATVGALPAGGTRIAVITMTERARVRMLSAASRFRDGVADPAAADSHVRLFWSAAGRARWHGTNRSSAAPAPAPGATRDGGTTMATNQVAHTPQSHAEAPNLDAGAAPGYCFPRTATNPTWAPTAKPTPGPTRSPTTPAPTASPSRAPSAAPTVPTSA